MQGRKILLLFVGKAALYWAFCRRTRILGLLITLIVRICCGLRQRSWLFLNCQQERRQDGCFLPKGTPYHYGYWKHYSQLRKRTSRERFHGSRYKTFSFAKDKRHASFSGWCWHVRFVGSNFSRVLQLRWRNGETIMLIATSNRNQKFASMPAQLWVHQSHCMQTTRTMHLPYTKLPLRKGASVVCHGRVWASPIWDAASCKQRTAARFSLNRLHIWSVDWMGYH